MTRAAGWHHLPRPSSSYLAGSARNLHRLAGVGAAAVDPEMRFSQHVSMAFMPSQQFMMAANWTSAAGAAIVQLNRDGRAKGHNLFWPQEHPTPLHQ